MSRPIRLIIDNSIHHVMARGNQKQKTFLDHEDYQKYLEILKHYKYKFRFKLFGYCLMPNHVHLIIRINQGKDLQKIVQGLNQTYTIWFNQKYDKVGHLWQGRYKNMLIQNNSYLIDCIEYVELNPVRAKIIERPAYYPWSSCQSRMQNKKDGLFSEIENS
ncbi:MAG: transposase [Candidatus Omnitrophica bacterium]|nr:transposase [Candidatus Omnitrophota bacterium]